MNKKKEKWLDELISRTIDSGKPEFDAEKWKQKYPEEFQLLKSQARGSASYSRASLFRIVLQSRISKLAAAAVIIIAVGFFVVHRGTEEGVGTAKVAEVTKSPAEMLTVMSLTIAYRQGGIEAVEEQCDKAFKMVGPRPVEISVQDLLKEPNRRNSERTRL